MKVPPSTKEKFHDISAYFQRVKIIAACNVLTSFYFFICSDSCLGVILGIIFLFEIGCDKKFSFLVS